MSSNAKNPTDLENGRSECIHMALTQTANTEKEAVPNWTIPKYRAQIDTNLKSNHRFAGCHIVLMYSLLCTMGMRNCDGFSWNMQFTYIPSKWLFVCAEAVRCFRTTKYVCGAVPDNTRAPTVFASHSRRPLPFDKLKHVLHIHLTVMCMRLFAGNYMWRQSFFPPCLQYSRQCKFDVLSTLLGAGMPMHLNALLSDGIGRSQPLVRSNKHSYVRSKWPMFCRSMAYSYRNKSYLCHKCPVNK